MTTNVFSSQASPERKAYEALDKCRDESRKMLEVAAGHEQYLDPFKISAFETFSDARSRPYQTPMSSSSLEALAAIYIA